MADENHLCYSKNAPHNLAYKKDNASHPLIFKVNGGKLTTITFAWGSDGKDLDICAYWDGDPDTKMGYGWNVSQAEQIHAPYHITYSGDIILSNASEWCKIKMSPWSGNNPRTFRVHFNFYGYNSEDYPANTCSVIASQEKGPTKILRDVSCSTRKGQKAETSDPGIIVTFDAKGVLTDLRVI